MGVGNRGDRRRSTGKWPHPATRHHPRGANPDWLVTPSMGVTYPPPCGWHGCRMAAEESAPRCEAEPRRAPVYLSRLATALRLPFQLPAGCYKALLYYLLVLCDAGHHSAAPNTLFFSSPPADTGPLTTYTCPMLLYILVYTIHTITRPLALAQWNPIDLSLSLSFSLDLRPQTSLDTPHRLALSLSVSRAKYSTSHNKSENCCPLFSHSDI